MLILINAAAWADAYIIAMRRLVAFLLLLFLGVSFVAQGAMAADMRVSMAPTSMDMPASQYCDDCGGEEGMPERTCSAVCGSLTAILPQSIPAATAQCGQSSPHAAVAQISLPSAPEPYPPKSLILS